MNMNFKFLFIPKPDTYDDGKLARLGLVIYWFGIVVAVSCLFAGISDPYIAGAYILGGVVFFFICRAVLFILADR